MAAFRVRILFFFSIIGPSLWYSYNWINSSPLILLFYVLLIAAISIWNPAVRIVALTRARRLMKVVAILFLAMSLIYFDEKHLPNLFIINVFDRLNRSPLFPIYVRSIVSFAALFLMYSFKGFEKTLGLLAFLTLFLTSGSTSRGSALILISGLFPLLQNKKLRIFLIILVAIFAGIYFSFIADLRGEASTLDYDKLEWNLMGYQPHPFNALFFFVPGFIKGEWLATNVLLSMEVLPLNQYFYIITFGDFANGFYGYGVFFLVFWAIFAIFAKLIFQFYQEISINFVPYLLTIYALIGGRVGLDNLAVLSMNSFILPLVVFALVSIRAK